MNSRSLVTPYSQTIKYSFQKPQIRVSGRNCRGFGMTNQRTGYTSMLIMKNDQTKALKTQEILHTAVVIDGINTEQFEHQSEGSVVRQVVSWQYM